MAAARRAGRGGVAEIYEVDAYQRRVAEGYDNADALRPGENVVVIDGDQSVEAVFEGCRAAVQALLSVGV